MKSFAYTTGYDAPARKPPEHAVLFGLAPNPLRQLDRKFRILVSNAG
jgi:hypothetical protein